MKNKFVRFDIFLSFVLLLASCDIPVSSSPSIVSLSGSGSPSSGNDGGQQSYENIVAGIYSSGSVSYNFDKNGTGTKNTSSANIRAIADGAFTWKADNKSGDTYTATITQGSKEETATFDTGKSTFTVTITGESGTFTKDSLPPEYVDFTINTDYKNSAQWYLPALNMSEVWKILNKYKRTKIRVAVVDTDIRMTHQEFEGIINKELAWDVVKNARLSGAGRISINTGHGTGVISVLAAVGKNMQGVMQGGIEIIPVAIDNSVDTGIYDKLKSALKAFKYIENLVENNKVKNLKVIGLSSSYIETDIKNSAGGANYEATIAELKTVIERLRNNYGVLTVAAGGNVVYQPTKPDDFVVPSDFSSVIGVTATDKTGNHQQGFCYNEHKDLSAPGVDILVATNNSDSSYYEKLVNEYPTGTSYSAPIVSGIAAMMWSLNPSMTVDEAVDILKTTATALPRDFTNKSNGVDYSAVNGSSGLVNPVAAITKVAEKGVPR